MNENCLFWQIHTLNVAHAALSSDEPPFKGKAPAMANNATNAKIILFMSNYKNKKLN